MKSATTRNSLSLIILTALTFTTVGLMAGDAKVRVRLTPPTIRIGPHVVIRPKYPDSHRQHGHHGSNCSCCRRQNVRQPVRHPNHHPVVHRPYKHPVVRHPVVSKPCYQNHYQHRYLESPSQRAWRYLRYGNDRSALVIFRQEVRRTPRNGRNWVGYALAAFQSNSPSEANKAMRHAILLDARDVYGLRVGYSVRQDLVKMCKTAMLLNCRRRRSPDADFIVAATSYVLGDKQTAARYIRRAIQAGDRQKSTLRLARELGVRSRC